MPRLVLAWREVAPEFCAKMNVASRNSSLDSTAKTSRSAWSERETMLLIDLWETYFEDLRKTKHNGAVYLEIAFRLRESGYNKSKKQVQHKIDNMTQMYRKWTRRGNKPAVPSWPFYRPIHRLMQKFKPKVIAASQEQRAVPMQSDETVQQVTDEVFPGPTETEHLLPDIPSPPTHLIRQLDVHLKQELRDEDASERSVGGQVEANGGITAHFRHRHEDRLASEFIESASTGTVDILKEILEEQKNLRLSIEDSQRRTHELLLRQTRLQERATEALIQVASAISSCIKAPSLSSYTAFLALVC